MVLCHFVSLIPVRQPRPKEVALWATCNEFLQVSCGPPGQHAHLLAGFLLHERVDCYVVCGAGNHGGPSPTPHLAPFLPVWEPAADVVLRSGRPPKPRKCGFAGVILRGAPPRTRAKRAARRACADRRVGKAALPQTRGAWQACSSLRSECCSAVGTGGRECRAAVVCRAHALGVSTGALPGSGQAEPQADGVGVQAVEPRGRLGAAADRRGMRHV